MNYSNDLPHIVFPSPSEIIPFTTPRTGGPSPQYPDRSRQLHAEKLKNEFQSAWTNFETEHLSVRAVREGVYVEFKSAPGFELPLKKLEDLRSKGIRLCNVRKIPREVAESLTQAARTNDEQSATVYITNSKKEYFLKKISDYLEIETETSRPKNLGLINSIESIKSAVYVESFWADDRELIPGDEPVWCEIWIQTNQPDALEKLSHLLAAHNIPTKQGFIKFPERLVKIAFVNHSQLRALIMHSDNLAEFRRSKETARFWAREPNSSQSEWVEELQRRLDVDRESLVSICVIDTGVNNGHPLLSNVLDLVDCSSVDSSWGTQDNDGHGTNMAGVAAYGDLQMLLQSSTRIPINHVLESVKILHQTISNPIELWGDTTARAVALPEIQAPARKRIFCMAISANDTRDRGRPSSWSGAIDNLCSGSDGTEKRLFIVCAGNPSDRDNVHIYPEIQISDSIHDPAQSWNAVTVGAFTQFDLILDPNFAQYQPVAQANQLSPFTTTSLTWDDAWPIKPEIVMEGGNAAIGPDNYPWVCDDLALLTTSKDFLTNQFETFYMTSAATALAGNFAAQIQSRYSNYWPETIRALMIHSASWPQQLKEQFAEDDSKTQIKKLMRVCGYGVPNLEKAISCAKNSLTIVAESEFQPYTKSNSKIHTKDMHLYRLPWPVELLQELGEAMVEMRITLSYFVEPGPGEIGWKDRYRYPSHQLKFDLNSPSESEEEFIRRVNAAVRDEDESHGRTVSPQKHWVIGNFARDKGSIHSDLWKGTAAELAGSNLISISPRIGWWKERSHLSRYESITRYSLIVSISTPENEIDIYTPVAQEISAMIPVEIQTGE